jgi:hypothetical protein
MLQIAISEDVAYECNQEPSPGSVRPDDENPEAVDVMLTYLYTFSDCLKVNWIDEVDFGNICQIAN